MVVMCFSSGLIVPFPSWNPANSAFLVANWNFLLLRMIPLLPTVLRKLVTLFQAYCMSFDQMSESSITLMCLSMLLMIWL